MKASDPETHFFLMSKPKTLAEFFAVKITNTETICRRKCDCESEEFTLKFGELNNKFVWKCMHCNREIPVYNPLKKVISGGETGADYGALMAASDYRIPTGGMAAPGYITEYGKRPQLRVNYNLEESKFVYSLAASHVTRSKLNVDNSTATLVFRLHSSVGTDKTRMGRLCKSYGRNIKKRRFRLQMFYIRTKYSAV